MSELKSSYHHDEIETAVTRLTDARTYVLENLGTKVFGEHNPVPIIEESIRGLNDADDVLAVERQIQERILGPVEVEFSSFSTQLKRGNIWAWAFGSLGILCTVFFGVWSFFTLKRSLPAAAEAIKINPIDMKQLSRDFKQDLTAAEAMAHLENIFGEFDNHLQHQELWRIEATQETRYSSLRDNAELIFLNKDIVSYSTPFRIGELIAIDRMSFRDAWTLEGSRDGPQVGSARMHSTSRYLFRRSKSSGMWFIEIVRINHSMPTHATGVQSRGTVLWGRDSVEISTVSFGSMLDNKGEYQDAPYAHRGVYKRLEEGFVIDTHNQFYEFYAGPDGRPLPMPDFTKPLGRPLTFTYAAEQQGAGEPPRSR